MMEAGSGDTGGTSWAYIQWGIRLQLGDAVLYRMSYRAPLALPTIFPLLYQMAGPVTGIYKGAQFPLSQFSSLRPSARS